MISKILFTILVIAGVIIYLRAKPPVERNKTQQVSTQKIKRSEADKMLRQGAYLFLIFMVISALVIFFFEIGDRYETVNVHVINTQTGERTSYQAEQQDIKSSMFTTLEGRTIYVADIERVEIEPE